YDGRSVTLGSGRLVRLLHEVQTMLDEQALSTPAARTAVSGLVELWRTTPDDGTGRWSLRHGVIDWHCTDGLLHIEAGDGGPYATPLAQPLVDVLLDLCWNSPD